MEELYLIYIHKIGASYRDMFFYEFIFSDDIESVDGEEWDSYPANGNPKPPFDGMILKVGKIAVDFELHVAQDNELFSMYDSMDGIIPLGWQNIDGLDEYPEDRVIFPFGMPIKDVVDKLYEKDVEMELENTDDDE